jgi:hypothetical protein
MSFYHPDNGFAGLRIAPSMKEGNNEGPGIGKEDLRQVQGHHSPRCGSGDLRERKTQAAPGLADKPGKTRKTPRQLSAASYQLSIRAG